MKESKATSLARAALARATRAGDPDIIATMEAGLGKARTEDQRWFDHQAADMERLEAVAELAELGDLPRVPPR